MINEQLLNEQHSMAGFDVPVLFLIFNRPDTTLEVFNAIKKVKPTRLYIAADGPRSNRPGEYELCEETRFVVQLIDWECELKTLFRESNLGCKEAVSEAISWFFENEEMGIILEDDCLPHELFFQFCKELLVKYKYDERIMLIGGQNFLANDMQMLESYYFSQYPHIWGWASWRRAWSNYNKELVGLEIFYAKKLQKCYISQAQQRHLVEQLNLIKHNKLNTWDYQWLFSILDADAFAVTPTRNLVINLGFRNQSTHTFLKDNKKEATELKGISFPLNHPGKLEINYQADYISFKNVLSKSPSRLFRLVRENGILVVVKHIMKRLMC